MNSSTQPKNQPTARRRPVDCSDHRLVVYSLGSLVERRGVFEAYDVSGDLVGTFPTMIAAARALPAGRSR